ncbi:MAG: lamin tail domain-containing protein [Bacillota bacterium]
MTLNKTGQTALASFDPQAPAPPPEEPTGPQVVIEKVDLNAELVVIRNKGTSVVSLAGWKILSVEGGQSYTFPSGFNLPAGGSVNVWSGKNAKDNPPTDLKWRGTYIWNNDGDPGILYDNTGEEVSRYGG